MRFCGYSRTDAIYLASYYRLLIIKYCFSIIENFSIIECLPFLLVLEIPYSSFCVLDQYMTFEI